MFKKIVSGLFLFVYMPLCRTYMRHVLGNRSADSLYRRMCSLYFLRQHGYWPDFLNARTFSEKVWNRMLYDRDPRWTLLSDKLSVRDYVASKIGADHLVPLLWWGSDPDKLPWHQLPSQFVIKATHGCGYNIAVTEKAQTSRESIKRKLIAWLKENYCLDRFFGVEWAYKNIEPHIIVEPFLGENDKAPTDYKFLCFSGRVEYIQVDYDRFERHAEQFFDRDFNRVWVRVGYPQYSGSARLPNNIGEMIGIAESLAQGLHFIRVDLYSVDDRIYFGELTCYPSWGTSRITPREYDFVFGAKWPMVATGAR